ncbi:hypothetical protein H5410_051714, partial [Solanum commersonii]
ISEDWRYFARSERDWNQTNTSYSGSEIYEWNLNDLTDRQLTILVHRMLMYATICKRFKSTYINIFKMIIVGFTGQLRGWWDNYMSIKQKAAVINATSDSEDVHNLNMALVKNREDVVYTLVLTILEHFNGRFTNQYETIHTLLNGLHCRTLGEFRWYKDTYMSRFIDDLPPLFAERVRKTPRNNHGEIPYKDRVDYRQSSEILYVLFNMDLGEMSTKSTRLEEINIPLNLDY